MFLQPCVTHSVHSRGVCLFPECITGHMIMLRGLPTGGVLPTVYIKVDPPLRGQRNREYSQWRAVCILLECILVYMGGSRVFGSANNKYHTNVINHSVIIQMYSIILLLTIVIEVMCLLRGRIQINISTTVYKRPL